MCDEQLNNLETRKAALETGGTYIAPDVEGCQCRVRHERAAATLIQSTNFSRITNAASNITHYSSHELVKRSVKVFHPIAYQADQGNFRNVQ